LTIEISMSISISMKLKIVMEIGKRMPFSINNSKYYE